MPLYSFHCERCDKYEDVFFKFDEEKVARCPSCLESMRREYRFTMQPDIQPYFDNTLGYIRNRKDKEAKLKQRGLIVDEPGTHKGRPGSVKRERYEEEQTVEEEVKDKYKHMIKTGKLDNPIIAKNVGL